MSEYSTVREQEIIKSTSLVVGSVTLDSNIPPPQGQYSQSNLQSQQAMTGSYTIRTSGVSAQQQNSPSANPQNNADNFLSKNLIIIFIVLGCISVTTVVIIVKKRGSRKIPRNVVAIPDPVPLTSSPQQVQIQPTHSLHQSSPPLQQLSRLQVNQVMDDLPRRKLKEIIAQYGSGIVNEPVKVKGLLLDYCAASTPMAGSNYQKEIHLLALALAQNIPQDLLTVSQNAPFEFKRARLQKRLTDLAIEEPAAKWAVQSWAEALSVNTKDKI
jgi:hypothetical protein